MVIDNKQTDQEKEQELKQAEAEFAATLAHVQALGIKLPNTLLDMSNWLTIKRYAEKYNLSQQVVVNWISRGIIPEECIKVVQELNDMRLVKDQTYRQP